MLTFIQIETQLGPAAEDRHVSGFELAIDYLEKRGIPPELMVELGIRVCPANELLESALRRKVYDERLAVVFPHLDIQGNYYDWWSCRLVGNGVRAGWQGAVVDRRGKMFCPPGEPTVAYLPPTLDWTKLEKGDRVYIHESALKAANGARLGRWSVGLNGVRGWSSRKHGHALIAGLKDIPWKTMELQPVIVFDSNTEDNPDVLDARVRLAAKLFELYGRRALALELPRADDGAHQGFDDYAVAVGDSKALAFLDGDGLEVELGEYELELRAMNNRVVLVENLSRIVEIDSGTMMKRGDFTDVNYAHITVEIGDEGKRTNFPRLWLTDERRRTVHELKYAPGEEKVTDSFLNLWKGMGVEPERGDVGPWLRLLEHNVPDPDLRRWMIQWFAYPLQNLGCKMTSFIHLYGPPGTGKNALLLPFMRIYGDNSVSLTKERVASDFNEGHVLKQFANIDELHGGNDAGALAITNKIKILVTSPKITVNGKGKPTYVVDNHLNLVTTSNYSDSIKLDEGDRRACVVQFGSRDTRIVDRGVWDAYYAWSEIDGAEALYDYLLGVDLSGFNPNGDAYATHWKELVTDATRGPMEKWARDLWDDPDSTLPIWMHGASVLTPDQVAVAYMPEETFKITPGLKNALGQRMQDLGFERRILKIDGIAKRVWIIRDQKGSWDNERVRTEYLKGMNMTKGKF
jgi:hypothetical protein